jgi:hypothetical protein
MASTFRIEGTLDRLVPVRGMNESSARDAYIRTDDGARLRVRLGTPELIEQARVRLSTRVVVTGALVPAGVHQGPRMVEVTLPVVDAIAPARVASEQGDDGAREGDELEGSWFEADELLEFIARKGVDVASLTQERLAHLVLECVASSERVGALLGQTPPEDALACLTAALIGEPWFGHAIAELLGHLSSASAGEDASTRATT